MNKRLWYYVRHGKTGMGNKKDLPRVQYAVLRLGKGRARDLHLLRPRLDAGAAFAIEADWAPRIEAHSLRIEALSPTPPAAAEVEWIKNNEAMSAYGY